MFKRGWIRIGVAAWVLSGAGAFSGDAIADFVTSFSGLRDQAIQAGEEGDLQLQKKALFETISRNPHSLESIAAVEDLKKILGGNEIQKARQEFMSERGRGFPLTGDRSLNLDRDLIRGLTDPEALVSQLAMVMKRGGMEAGESTLLAVLAGASGQMGVASFLLSKTDRIIMEVEAGERPSVLYTRSLRPLEFRFPEIFSRYSALNYRAEALDIIPFIEPERGVGRSSWLILNAGVGLRYQDPLIPANSGFSEEKKGVVQEAQLRAEIFSRTDRSLRTGLAVSSHYQKTPNEAFTGYFPWTHFLQGHVSYVNFKNQEYKLEVSSHLSNRKVDALQESRRSFGVLGSAAIDWTGRYRIAPYLGTRSHIDRVSVKSGRTLEAGVEGAQLNSGGKVNPVLNYDYWLSPVSGPQHRFSTGAVVALNSWAKMRFYPEFLRQGGQTTKSMNLKMGTLHMSDLLSTTVRVAYTLQSSQWLAQLAITYELRD